MRNNWSTQGPEVIHIPTEDGYMLKGHYWRHVQSAARNVDVPVVVINPATSVAARYYHRFAAYL